jgi:uncharacterized phiE125 gp8 family phage protein
MSYEIVTPPASEPVTVDEAAAHLRVDSADEYALIKVMILAATEWVETHTSKAVITQTVKAYFREFPADEKPLVLPFGNASSITEIGYLDEDGVAQTMDASPAAYLLDVVDPPKVWLKHGETWPDTLDQQNAVSVTYVAGDSAAPARIKQAILIMVADMYENREAQIVGPSVSINGTVERLVGPVRELGL